MLSRKVVSVLIAVVVLTLAAAFSVYAETGSCGAAPVEVSASAAGADAAPATENAAPASASTMKVIESALCTSVDNRVPAGQGSSFPSSVGRVYFWTNIEGAVPPTQIRHIWYFKGEKMAEITLAVKYSTNRTWSYKTILPEWAGDWSVEAVDESGNVLTTASFKVTSESVEVQQPATPEAPAQGQ